MNNIPFNPQVRLYEVGPRDGLQNEKTFVTTDKKVKLINALSRCGFDKIEVTSFVSPKWVPQMADAAQVMEAITRDKSVDYAALAPNIRGLEDAISAGVDEVAVFISASEGFSRHNINCSIEKSMEYVKSVADMALKNNINLRGYLSCVIECPYDGATDPADVLHWGKILLDHGCYEVSLGDTIGKGTPKSTSRLLDLVCAHIDPSKLAGHFHDTGGKALKNIEIALEYGLRVFDSSIGGLGGCPYAPGSTGNVATEAVVNYLETSGFSTGIDRQKLESASQLALSLTARD